MRAIVQRRYGAPDKVLEVRDLDVPTITDDEVLVRVHAASIHPDVWHVLTGRPLLVRVMGAGLRKPKVAVPGTDVAGRVETVGANVTRFTPGDEVYGEIVKGNQWGNGGAFAEYAVAAQAKLEPKPVGLSFVEAAAVPTSGLIAMLNMRGVGKVAARERVLVNGAGGGVGVFAVQIAIADGAHVTAVDATDKLDMLRSIGAEQVIDYTVEDFTRGGGQYDLIFDIPGNRPFADLKRVVGEDGRYVLVGHDQYNTARHRIVGSTIPRFLWMLVRAPLGRRPRIQGDAAGPRTSLAALSELIEAGKVAPVIDRTFPLEEVREAMRYLAEGRAVGKVVLTV